MGFISDYANKQTFPGQGRERNLWNRVFGAATKEDGLLDAPRPSPDGEGRNRSASSLINNSSYGNLLKAYRARYTSSWTDNRYEQSTHFTGISYCCIHRTCEQMAQAELRVFQKDDMHPDGKREVTKRHDPEAYKLVELLERPNREDSFSDLMYNLNQQMDMTGLSYFWMVPNVIGTPMEMYPLSTVSVQPQPILSPEFPDGYYRIQPVHPTGVFAPVGPGSAAGAIIPSEWMLRFKYPHPYLRWDGYSPMTALRLHIDEVESMDRSRWYSMKRSINPSAVLNMEELGPADQLPEQEIDRIRTEFEADFQGPENTGRLYVSAPGSKLEPWGMSPKDMEYQSGWDQLVSFVMAGYGITKQAAGMIEDSSYATLFATLKQFHLLTLEPKCRRISNGLTRNLAPFFGEGLIVEIKAQRIDDHDVANAKIGVGIQAIAITKNEVRKQLGYPITMEPWGNEFAGMPPTMLPMVPPGHDPADAMLLQQQQMAAMGLAPPLPQGGMMAPGVNPQHQDELAAVLQGQGAGGMGSLLAREGDEDRKMRMTGMPGPGNLGVGGIGPRKSFTANGNRHAGRHK